MDPDSGKRDIYWLVVMFLGVISLTAVMGAIILAAVGKPAPEALTNLAFSSVGALGGMLIQPKGENKEGGPPPLPPLERKNWQDEERMREEREPRIRPGTIQAPKSSIDDHMRPWELKRPSK